MTLSLAGQPLTAVTDLSDTAQACLGLVDGGTLWAGWAIAQPSAGYAFADEAALVAGVQSGLHGRALMLLPGIGLTVGPARLMALEPAQLRTLAKAEAAGKAGAAVGKLLTESKLLTATDFAGVAVWLDGQGVYGAPVFQVLSLTDQAALAGLAAGGGDAALAKEASAFAVAEARTPAEFVDYFRLYGALAARPGTATPQERQALARSCLDILLPWMFGALDCPSLPTPAAQDAVSAALTAWLQNGRLVGFGNAVAGARQICERTDFTPETPNVGALVAGYLGQASAVIAAGPVSMTLNQDGQSARLQAGGVTVGLAASGDLSLDDFQPPSEPG